MNPLTQLKQLQRFSSHRRCSVWRFAKPVRFQYKNDNTKTAQFGLIAEDVARVNPDLVVRDENGEIYTIATTP